MRQEIENNNSVKVDWFTIELVNTEFYKTAYVIVNPELPKKTAKKANRFFKRVDDQFNVCDYDSWEGEFEDPFGKTKFRATHSYFAYVFRVSDAYLDEQLGRNDESFYQEYSEACALLNDKNYRKKLKKLWKKQNEILSHLKELESEYYKNLNRFEKINPRKSWRYEP